MRTRNRNKQCLAGAFISLLLLSFLSLGANPVNKTFFGSKAIEGYDVVAYFLQKRPVQGKKKYSFHWKGANWFFASAKNRDLFKKAPKKYAPQFGGYCAYAVSKGHTAGIDPNAWDIYKGKLYLNYDRDVQAKWRKNKALYIKRADKNWPALEKK